MYIFYLNNTMSRARTPMPPVHAQEPDEIEDEDDDDMDEEMDEGMDMFEVLGSLLATEDGETIATILHRLSESTEKIAMNLEMQNKIMVKILTTMGKSTVCNCTGNACRPSDAA